jgi:hypothetical protein
MARSKRPHILNHSVKVKGAKSGKKIENAIKHFKNLEKRATVEGDTLWLANAKKFVLAKFKKYSINPKTI